MSPVASAAGLVDVSRVIKRLDQASTMLGLLNPERGHAILYAGFLTDVEAGRLDVREKPVAEMVLIVDQFCTLVEGEFAEPTYQ
jgi:hypothetical protein